MARRRVQVIVSIGVSATILSAQAFFGAADGRLAARAADEPATAEALPLATATTGRRPIAIAAANVPVVNELTPGAREAAALLGILPQVERLIEIRRARGTQHSDVLTDEELALKVDVFDRVLGASLEIKMVAGRIDRELAWSYSGLGMLQGRKQKLINNIVTANFMQIGILGVLSGPAFLHGKPKLGTELLLIASCLGLTFSTAAFIVNRTSPTKKIDGGTTVLADVFHLEQTEPRQHKTAIVVGYMNASPPGAAAGTSRIQTLIDSWKKGKYLRSSNETALEKLAAMEPTGKHYTENIRILNSRIRMLFDTQYTIESLHTDLLDLLRVTDLG